MGTGLGNGDLWHLLPFPSPISPKTNSAAAPASPCSKVQYSLASGPNKEAALSDGSHKGQGPSNPRDRGTCTPARPGLKGSKPGSAKIRGFIRAALK